MSNYPKRNQLSGRAATLNVAGPVFTSFRVHAGLDPTDDAGWVASSQVERWDILKCHEC